MNLCDMIFGINIQNEWTLEFLTSLSFCTVHLRNGHILYCSQSSQFSNPCGGNTYRVYVCVWEREGEKGREGREEGMYTDHLFQKSVDQTSKLMWNTFKVWGVYEKERSRRPDAEKFLFQEHLKKGVWLPPTCPRAEGWADQLNAKGPFLKKDKKIEMFEAHGEGPGTWLENRGVWVQPRAQDVSAQSKPSFPRHAQWLCGHPQQGPINPSFVPISPNTHKCKVNSRIKAFNVLCTVLFEKIRSDIWEEESIWLGWAQEASDKL